MTVRTETARVLLKSGGALCVKPRVGVVVETKADALSGLVALVSTPSVDSYGDIIHQSKNDHGAGWLLDRFNAHPAMLWGHNIELPSIGGGKAYVAPHAKYDEGLYLEPEFDMPDPLAATVAGKIERGVISETSVGFVSRLDQRREDAAWGYEFFEQELLEISWVNRGANPDVDVMFKSILLHNADIAEDVDGEKMDSVTVERLQKDLIDLRAEFSVRIDELQDGRRKLQPEFDRMDTAHDALKQGAERLSRALSGLTR